jgi:hypothetical protein
MASAWLGRAAGTEPGSSVLDMPAA